MKVSVLIPVYNVARYVERCAVSLMEQTHGDLELIFVDDCSPDDSVAVIRAVTERYPSRRGQVRVIRHERNGGLGQARLSGLNAATGDAILIVDSDDYVATNAVALLAAEMERSGADIVDGGYAIVTGGIERRRFVPPRIGDEAYLRRILCQNVEANRIWGRLIRRSLFTDHDIRFTPGIDYCEDFSVLPRLLYYARRSTVGDILYYYRDDNAGSYTNNITPRAALSFLRAQQLVAQFFSEPEPRARYGLAAETGWVNVWRFVRRFGVDPHLVEEHFTARPSHAAPRLLAAMMRSRAVPFGMAQWLYRAARAVYLNLSK